MPPFKSSNLWKSTPQPKLWDTYPQPSLWETFPPLTPTPTTEDLLGTMRVHVQVENMGYTNTNPVGDLSTTNSSGGYLPINNGGYLPTNTGGYLPTNTGGYLPTNPVGDLSATNSPVTNPVGYLSTTLRVAMPL